MRKKFVQIAATVLLAGLCLSLAPGAAPRARAAVAEDQIIRVGIYFDGSALPGVNMTNAAGSGFRLGYYDGDNRFVQLASTDQTDLSVVKTENVYYVDSGGYASYYNYTGGGQAVVIGCYHLQLPGSYGSFEQAQAAAQAYSGGFAAYIDGAYYARVGNYPDRAGAEQAQSQLSAQGVSAEIRGTSAYGVSVVRTGSNQILFQYDDLGAGTGLGVEPNAAGDQGEDYRTRFHNINWRGGFRFERVNGGNLTIANLVSLGDYVKGVVPHEMSNAWPLEALKAQAVCARTYTLTNLNRHSSGHFDLCNESHCQVYLGVYGAGTNSDQAVDETAGQVAIYNGELAECYYHSSNGGATEGVNVVWGSNQSGYPYLVGVNDPYEALVADRIDNYEWTRTVTGEALTQMLHGWGYTQASLIATAQVSQYSDTGNPAQVTFTDQDGRSYTVASRRVVTYFGLRSYRYDFVGGGGQLLVNGQPVDSLEGLYAIGGNGQSTAVGEGAYLITGDGTIAQAGTGGGQAGADGTFTIAGSGWGHNVGMSQWGAYAQALEGRTYREILTFYYTGITVG